MKFVAFVAVVGLAINLSGCTHIQLRNNTTRQARTVSDMHTQQVLNNLAMFVYEPGSFPSFSTFKQGTSTVTDAGQFATPLTFARLTGGVFGLSQLGVNPSVSRQSQEAWVIEPINDPRKLELMRCAYQRAVGNCHPVFLDGCPDCEKRFKAFYTGSAKGDMAKVAEKGFTTSDCLEGNGCWFCVGDKEHVPADCCDYQGHYCGITVWVPASGRNELSKLTLAILDYAFNEPAKAVQNTKEVTWYLDEKLKPTTGPHAVRIKAILDRADDPYLVIEEDARAQLKKMLADKKISEADFKRFGPFYYLEVLDERHPSKLSPSEFARIIVLLDRLHIQPATDLIALANAQKPPVTLVGLLNMTLEGEDAEKMLRIRLAFPASLEGVRVAPAIQALLDEGRLSAGAALFDLDLSGSTPIVIPSQPTPSTSDSILEQRTILNTVTPPPLILTP